MTFSYNSLEPNSLFKTAITDMKNGLNMWRIWTSLSYDELKRTYSRSIFGFLWITLTFAAFIFVKLIIFSSILDNPDEQYYNAYLASGFYIWQYISLSVISAPRVFVNSESWIKNDPLPLSLYVYKQVMREIYNLLFSALVVVAAFMYIKYTVDLSSFQSLPALLIIIFNAVWVKYVLGVICTRYRDIDHLVKAIFTAMLFLAPIFWLPSQISPKLLNILWWNPIFHFMEIFRAPLLGDPVAPTSWVFVITTTIIGWAAALILYSKFRRRIVFWF